MTDRKPPAPPAGPPPLPPRMDTVRPGLDRPEERPRTAGKPARPSQQTLRPTRPPYDPNRPPVGQHSRSAPPTRRGLGWGSVIVLLLVGVVVTGGGVIGYLTYAPPVDLIRQQVIAQVKAKTGRDLTIAGPTTFAILPSLTITMKDVALSAPVGMGGTPLVTMAGLETSVKLWPLLQRKISVDRLILRQPVFDLRVNKAGKRSWDFATLFPVTAPVQYAQATPPQATATDVPDAIKDFKDNASDPDNPSPQLKSKLARLEELTLGDVRIEGGTIIYADERAGTNQHVTGVDARVGLKSLASPLDAVGTFTYEGQPFDFDVKLASVKAIVEDRPAKLAVTLKGAPVEASYDGTVTVRSTVDLDGTVTAKGPSLRAVTRLLGHELPPADGFGPVSLSGKLKATDKSIALGDANLGLDGATATGTVLLDTSGARPKVNANLKISELDLNRYTLAAGTAVPKSAVKRPTAIAAPHAPAPAPAANGAKSIEDLINGAGGPQVKGYTKRAGWSEERIPLEALGEFDADAKLSVGKLHYHEIKVGQSALTVTLKSKVLRVNFDDVTLYEGHGKGFIQVDANPAAPVVGANLSVDGVAAQGLLKDVADFELLSGTSRLTVAVGAQGVSEAQLVQTSNGKAEFAFTNGAIVGYNIPGAIRGISQGKFAGLGKNAAEKTDFSELAASFTIANGIATNQDLRLIGPLLRVTGGGQIALPGQTVAYTVKPKLVASLEGQGSGDALAGLEIPINIRGPWANPEIAPDVGAILKDPGKAVEAVKELGKQLEKGTGKDLGKAVKELLGKDDGKGTEVDGKKVKKLLDGIFR